MINKLQAFYTEGVEDFCTRLLYFMNTIDTYFLFAGILSFLVVHGLGIDILTCLLLLVISYVCFKTIADFYPSFMLLTPIYLLFFYGLSGFNYTTALMLLLANIAIFAIIQFLFMGIPDAIVSRDATVPFGKLWHSLFTIAPTTVSFCMSVYFSTLLSMVLMFQPLPREKYGLALWSSLFVGALVARFRKPKSFVSENFKPKPPATKKADRIIFLNIDGVRLDRFYEANLPFMNSIRSEATYFPSGLQTVYRALTNPAFVSILSGTTPDVHGIISNNINTGIKVQCLPDIIKTRLYGSMHVRHF